MAPVEAINDSTNNKAGFESLAISSLVVESCFDSSRQGEFLVDDSGVKGVPFFSDPSDHRLTSHISPCLLQPP